VVALVRCENFDLGATEALRRELRDIVNGGDRLPLLLDLSLVDTVPTSTLGALVELARHMNDQRRSLALVNVSDGVRRLMEASAIDRLFAMFDDNEQAIAGV